MFGARICGDSPDVLVHLSGLVIELYAPDIGRRVGAQCFSGASERSKILNSESKRHRAMKLVSIKSSCCAASYERVHISKSHVKANRTRSNAGEQYM